MGRVANNRPVQQNDRRQERQADRAERREERRARKAQQAADFPRTPVTEKSAEGLRQMFRTIAEASGLSDALQGVDQLLAATNFVVVPDGQLSANAAFDPTTGQVMIPERLAERLQQLSHKLMEREKGTSKKDHLNALEKARRGLKSIGDKSSEKFHGLAAKLALIVHEAKHAEQHRSGALDNLRQQLCDAHCAGGEQRAIDAFVRIVELPAQRMQEKAQLALGEPPEESSFQTMRWDAATKKWVDLSDEEAIRNMLAARPELAQQALAIHAGESEDGHDHDGKYYRGADIDGKYYRGEDLHGKYYRGEELEGKYYRGPLLK